MDYFVTPKSQKIDEVTGISRSGRVRKKSSKLADFASPDDLTDYKIRKQRQQQQAKQLHAQQLLEKYEQKLQQQRYQNVSSPQQSNSLQQTNYTYNTNFNQQNRQYQSEQGMVKMKQEYNKQESSSEDDDDSSESGSDEANESQEPNGIENDDGSSMESTSDDDDDDDEEEEEEVEDPLMMDQSQTVQTQVESPGFTKLEPLQQYELPTSKAKNSLYMLEKYKKKLVIKDGKVINNKTVKIQRKDKGKARFTAYMMWAKDARQHLLNHHPTLDFSQVSKKLGEMWALVPTLEKYNWKKRAKRMADMKINDLKIPPPATPQRKFINKTVTGVKDSVSPKKTIQLGTPFVGNKLSVSPSIKIVKDSYHEPFLGTGMYKVTGTQPIDIAAHLTLLGESLTIIGKRLKEHEGQITVSGSLPLLLDSLLCALGPLLCLTQQIPEMNGANPDDLTTILENVAYIMPGL